MHRDPLPGVFDFAAHSVQYTIGVGLLIGFVLSILIQVGILIARSDSIEPPKASTAALEGSMTARRAPSAAPAATAAVRY